MSSFKAKMHHIRFRGGRGRERWGGKGNEWRRGVQ